MFRAEHRVFWAAPAYLLAKSTTPAPASRTLRRHQNAMGKNVDFFHIHMLHGAGILSNIKSQEWPSFAMFCRDIYVYISYMEHLGYFSMSFSGLEVILGDLRHWKLGFCWTDRSMKEPDLALMRHGTSSQTLGAFFPFHQSQCPGSFGYLVNPKPRQPPPWLIKHGIHQKWNLKPHSSYTHDFGASNMEHGWTVECHNITLV